MNALLLKLIRKLERVRWILHVQAHYFISDQAGMRAEDYYNGLELGMMFQPGFDNCIVCIMGPGHNQNPWHRNWWDWGDTHPNNPAAPYEYILWQALVKARRGPWPILRFWGGLL